MAAIIHDRQEDGVDLARFEGRCEVACALVGAKIQISVAECDAVGMGRIVDRDADTVVNLAGCDGKGVEREVRGDVDLGDKVEEVEIALANVGSPAQTGVLEVSDHAKIRRRIPTRPRPRRDLSVSVLRRIAVLRKRCGRTCDLALL